MNKFYINDNKVQLIPKFHLKHNSLQVQMKYIVFGDNLHNWDISYNFLIYYKKLNPYYMTSNSYFE